MDVAVYANPLTTTPYLCILYPGLDEIEVAAEKALEAESIPYKIVDLATLPQGARYVFNALTVDLSGADPAYDFDFPYAQKLARETNTSYWNLQYLEGLSEIGITELEANLALNTPEGERDEIQVAAVELMNEITNQKQSVAYQLTSATTGEELNAILETALG